MAFAGGAQPGWFRVDLTRFREVRKRVVPALHGDILAAVNDAAAATAELLRAATPRLTGKTARSIGVQKSRSLDELAVAGFFPRKGNTAFVARILEQGRKPKAAEAAGERVITRARVAQGRRRGKFVKIGELRASDVYATLHKIRIRGKRGASFMAARPILPRVLPLVSAVIREAFRRVFGPDWRPRV